MGQEGLLGSFEALVLLAVAHEADQAYGMTVRRQIEQRSGRSVTIGAVYATLERLLAKRLLASRSAAPEERQARRARRYYRLTPAGARALVHARDVTRQMWEGLDLARLAGPGGGT